MNAFSDRILRSKFSATVSSWSDRFRFNTLVTDSAELPGAGRPLRVLLLNEFFYPDNQGGTPTATWNIASRLVRNHGVQVDVITTITSYRDASVRFSREEVAHGVHIHRIASPNWLRKKTPIRFLGNLIFATMAFLKARQLPRPDVVLVTTAPLTLPLAAQWLKSVRKVPFAYLIYDLDPDRTIRLGLMPASSVPVKLWRSLQDNWFSLAGRVIAIGRCMQAHLITHYQLPKEKVPVVEVGADPNVVRPISGQSQFRAAIGNPEFVLLYSGNFGQYHDFSALLTAAEIFLRDDPGVRFVLVGGGHKRAEVEQEVAARMLENVSLHDYVPEEELADLMAAADLQLVTLEPGLEGLCVPSKFYTYLASGCPVMALMNQGSEVAQVIAEVDCGWVVPTDEPESFIEAIKQARKDPALLAEKGKRAREVFELEYTADRIAEKMVAVLTDVASSR